jgi:hypothetical protein
MSRSRHHGCGRACLLCRPHKHVRGRNWGPRSKRAKVTLAERVRDVREGS